MKMDIGGEKLNKCTEIKVDFVEGGECPWSATREDFINWIAPHHIDPVHRKIPASCFPKNTESFTLNCPCGLSREAETNLATTCPQDRGDKSSAAIEWLDPRGLPVACLRRLLVSAIGDVKSGRVANIGIAIPKSDSGLATTCGPHSELELVTAMDFSGRKPVWYPSLANDVDSLIQIAQSIDPVEIFPIVELTLDESLRPDTEQSVWKHVELLEGRRVRTEKTIYLDPRRPELTYSIMVNSFAALQIGGLIPKIPVVTPGGTAQTVLCIIIAAVISNSIIALSEEPLLQITPTKDDIWGFAILRGKG